MKLETLLSKEELNKVMLRHILENDLVSIDMVHVNDQAYVEITLEDVLLTAGEVREIVKTLTDEEPAKQSIVITPDGSLGVESEFTVEE